jgi:type I restriction enzyme M protein
VERRFGRKEADRLFFYMQESNPSTANIARINMILHGVRGYHQAPAQDSIRSPYFREGQTRRLRQFDRIVMNPPFSLESWGYDDFAGGDPYDRFVFGMPPRDNGDYAWMYQVVKSLKPTGRAIIVMSQGILFRGQPEQTEAEDGRNQKADAEYTIREGFIKTDLIECVIVLPSKLFYGNSVPGCLVVINKRKAPEQKGKILLIWASRHYQSSNPQNILRRADCMRVLVPWRAFGDLGKCCALIPEHEQTLISQIEHDRDAALNELEEAYGPFLAPLPEARKELAEREVIAQKEPPKDKEELKAFREAKKANTERLKELKRQVRALEKLEAEAEEKKAAVRQHGEREIALVRENAADLAHICSDPIEARRYFVSADRAEIEENEFNLNLPRYVDTFEPEEKIAIDDAVAEYIQAKNEFVKLDAVLSDLVKRLNGGAPLS